VNPFGAPHSATTPAPQARARGPGVSRDYRQALLTGALVAAGLMCLVPFLVPTKSPPIPSFHAELAAVVLGLLALTSLAAWNGRLDLPRVAWLPIAFVVLLLLQTGLGLIPYPQRAWLAAAYLIWAAALIVLGGLLKQELGLDRVVAWIAWLVLAGALGSAVIGVMQHLESYAFLERWITPSSRQRVWANLAQPNHLADYLMLGLVSAGYLYATGRLRWVYATGATLLIAYVLTLTGSRAPWVYLAALTALSIALRAGGCDPASGRRLQLYSGATLAAFTLLWFGAEWIRPVLEMAPAPTSGARVSQASAAEARPQLAQVAWRMFREHPFLGAGFGEFGIQHFLINADLPAPRPRGFNGHAHNLVLHVMAELGLLGLVALLAGGLPWLLGLLRQPRVPALWWVAGVAAVFAVHSFFEYPLWYAYFLGPAALVLGLGETRTLSLRRNNDRSLRRRLVLGGMLALGWVTVVQLTRDFVLLENFHAFRFRYIHANAEIAERSKAMLAEVGRHSLLAPYVDLGLARTIPIDTDRLEEKLLLNRLAMQAFPIDDVVYRQAMLLALSGDVVGAKRQWLRAVASFPGVEPAARLVLRRRIEDGVSGLAPLASELDRQE
jgi:O-antigen ligase